MILIVVCGWLLWTLPRAGTMSWQPPSRQECFNNLQLTVDMVFLSTRHAGCFWRRPIFLSQFPEKHSSESAARFRLYIEEEALAGVTATGGWSLQIRTAFLGRTAMLTKTLTQYSQLRDIIFIMFPRSYNSAMKNLRCQLFPGQCG